MRTNSASAKPDRRLAVSDRRDEPRAPFVAAVLQRIGSAVQLALAQNLSEHGIELRRAPGQSYLPSTPVSLTFELPDGCGVLKVRGIVVWGRADGGYQTAGVRFSDVAAADEARLRRFLERIAPPF
jgi:hypothetical protein